MSRLRCPNTLAVLSLLGGLALSACDATESPSSPADDPVAVLGHGQPRSAASAADLAAARAATAHVQRFENAAPAGWDFPIPGCKEHPELGGMGFHFGNFEFYMNGEVDPAQPEILLYEPQANGELRLVAVEYVIPFFAWDGDPAVDDPPVIFGQEMKRVDEQGEWQLHVWIWKHNPSGMFADWNPRVSCDHA